MLFKNKYGQLRKTEVGFSFSVLIFGAFVPMVRKDVLGTIAMMMSAIGSLLILNLWIYALSFVFYAFVYNKNHIIRLLKQGYYPVEECHAKLIVAYNVVSLEEIKKYKNERSEN